MIGFGSAQVMGENPDFALMFVAPMDAEGVKLSPAPLRDGGRRNRLPYDYPLSSRFDENDAILVMDHVLIPWENVLIYRDFDRCRRWTMEGGFARMYPLQACVRLAVKARLHHRPAEEIAGMHRHPGVPRRAGGSRRSGGLAQYVLGAERLHVLKLPRG
jgi:aromatic ring hydroxylase